MKNQYIGDIGDYGKYGMLRFFASLGIRIGVNWYLCPNDGRPDGNHTEYLYDERMRVYDPEVYDIMKQLAFLPNKCIQMVENSGILDGMVFYDEFLDLEAVHWSVRAEGRKQWHQAGLTVLREADLIFADPDNSLTTTKKPSAKDAQKFILPEEIEDYFQMDKDIVYYHHRSRKNEAGWMEEKIQIKKYLPDACLLALAFRRWSRRVYIFVVHKNKIDFYKQAIYSFLGSAWGTQKVDGKTVFMLEDI